VLGALCLSTKRFLLDCILWFVLVAITILTFVLHIGKRTKKGGVYVNYRSERTSIRGISKASNMYRSLVVVACYSQHYRYISETNYIRRGRTVERGVNYELDRLWLRG
jgi:hypothetical protein